MLFRSLTSVDATDFDVAEDAISWQTILNSIRRFVIQYDMTSIIMIPQGVDFYSPLEVAKARSFKDAIVAWMRERELRGYFYWALNPNSSDTGGILQDDWRTPNALKLMLLQRLMR